MFNVGDKVWSPVGGWGIVDEITSDLYCVKVKWNSAKLEGLYSLCTFTKDGKIAIGGEQVLFKHQLDLSTAKKVISVPPVDTLVKVKNGDDCYRYSSGVMRGDSLVVYMAGRTSKTVKHPDDVIEYESWEIVE